MRILFLINSLGGGGAERVTAGLANHWARAGHEVVVILLGAADGDAGSAYLLDQRVTLEALGLGAQSASALAGLAANRTRLAAVTRALARHRPDVAIAMMTSTSVLLALAGAPRGMARIGAERTYPPFAETSRLWRTARALAYGRLDAVVAQTEQAAAWLRRHTLGRRVEVINNPVLQEGRAGPHVAPDAVVPAGTALLLAIGRLSPEKQFEALIGRFGALAASRPDWRLTILGEGGERERLERARTDSGCADRIALVGRVANIDQWLDRADLFVMTSAFEGFPNALLEAYCAGVPCVSFDCLAGPSSIILDDGADGLLVAPDDFGALGAALGRLMDDPGLRGELARAALERAGRFKLESIAARWETLFASLGVRS